jgi:CBS domain-containing protein
VTVKLVRDLMHIGVTTCREDTSLLEGVRTLLREQLEALIVLDNNGHAVGMFTRKDAVTAFGQSGTQTNGGEALTVVDVMCPEIPEIPPDIPATAAVQIMLDQGVREMYLLHHDGGIRWPAAALCFEDVLRYLATDSDEEIDFYP